MVRVRERRTLGTWAAGRSRFLSLSGRGERRDASRTARRTLLSREAQRSLLSRQALGMCCWLVGFVLAVGMKEM